MAILSIDYGKRKIGVAFSDEGESIAFVDKDLHIVNDNNLFANLKEIVIEKRIDKLLVGLPYNNGSETAFTHEVRKFAKDFANFIKQQYAITLQVDFVDEIMTSRIGSQFIVQKRGKNKKVKKFDTKDDNFAAWVMLSAQL
ncbi:Holliday junction resolvase RuvX [bacterium]|nr:MAG: Holliday junction resolvase RuvX [bacterium]